MSTDQSESNKSSANSVSNLATEAKKLTAHGFAIIPLNDRIPIIKYKHRRKDLATTREIDNWFSDGDGRVAKANGIAIAINTTEFGLDTDGEQCEFIFLDKIVPNLSPSLQEKILNTMHTQTPHGHHRTFRYAASDFPNGIKEKTYFRLNGEHSEIALKGKDHYLFERGPGYKTINDVEHVATLTKAEVEEFIGALEKFSNKEEALTKVVNKLQEYFVKPHRNDIIFSVSGYLHKSKTPLETTIEIAKRLIDATGYDDENPDKIYRTIRDTYSKDRDSDQVSGHRRLREVLKQASPKNDGRIDDVLEIISLIEQTLKKVGLFEISWKEHKQAGEELLRENFDAGGEYDNESSRDSIELAGINTDILVQLASDVISLISISPPVLYIADSREKHIIKAVVRNESGNTEESKNAKGQNQTIITKQQKLYRKDKIILAVPRGKVVINNSLLTDLRTYTVTFASKVDKKPFTIGPGTIDYIIGELDNRNKIIKKLDAGEALRAILNRYEEKGLAEINESVTQPGYYYLNGKFITHKVTQNIEKDPDPAKVLECIKFLNELSTKWHNPDIFPTVIKWSTLAPFDYILKAVGKWLPNLHDHGWSSSGKSSIGRLALAVWRVHTNVQRKDYQLNFGNIDNVARFGSVISRSTYPILINEVGALREKFYRSLVETVKAAIESPFVRGKYLDSSRYQNIPALCKLFLTSNPRPPDDSGYRSKTTIIQHTKDDVHERGQKDAVEFEKWFESRSDTLGILGDFIARYVIFKPEKAEDSILFSGKSHDVMAKEIITEFYRLAGEDRPDWLDRTYEQKSIRDENTEQAYFEIRAFLMNQVTEAYTRHMKAIDPQENIGKITFQMRLNSCLQNKLIPYLHEHITKDEEREIRITHDMLTELHKKVGNIEGVNTMLDLSKELPNFRYINGKIGPKSGWILAGEWRDLVDFLDGKSEDSSN